MQSQSNCVVNQIPTRTNNSIQSMMNYPKFAPAVTKNNDSYKPKNNSTPASGVSKFVTCPNQPSMDKAGNPICFKCGKIRYTRDCPKHPYKPRVYTQVLQRIQMPWKTCPKKWENSLRNKLRWTDWTMRLSQKMMMTDMSMIHIMRI